MTTSNQSKEGITFGVSCTGNLRALCMCLASVLNSRRVPHRIQVLMNGEFPSFGDFYLEQISEWARQSGVAFNIAVENNLGVRKARDWHLDNCQTQFLWMGDDDVVYEPDCLKFLALGWKQEQYDQAYVQGVKSDLNNRRGYEDFEKKVIDVRKLEDFSSPNHRYGQLPEAFAGKPPTYDVATIDTGNVVFDMKKMNGNTEASNFRGYRFDVFKDSANCGGEDTLMALRLRKDGLVGRFMPWAVSFHLEKEKPKFDEIRARGEMLLRVCDSLGLDKELLKKGFAPWAFR